MITSPNFADHYWIVAGEAPAAIYSSARNVYVQSDDVAYVAWLADGGLPSRILNEAELWDVLATARPGVLPAWLFNGVSFVQPAVGAFSKAQLSSYANGKQWSLATGGCLVSIGGVPVGFATTEASMSLLAGKVARLQQPNPPTVINWQTGATSFSQIAAADFIVAATTVADFVQHTFDVLSNVFAQIEAGTITAPAGIDAAFAS